MEINTKVKKLTEANAIREAHYPEWVAKVILDKKANEKCRVCTDFTDLNQARPKDSFPLPRIDQLVEPLPNISCSASWMRIPDTIKFKWPLKMRKEPRSLLIKAFIVTR